MQPARKKQANASVFNAGAVAPGHARSAANSEVNQHPLPALVQPAPVQRFFTKPIAGQVQQPFLPIPEGQGKHARAALQSAVQAPRFDGSQQGFRIGMTAPRGLELAAQIEMVVDLAVESDQITPTGTAHRLMPGRERSTTARRW